MNWLAYCPKDLAQGIKFGSSELESRAAWSLPHLASYTMLCNVSLKLISQVALGNKHLKTLKGNDVSAASAFTLVEYVERFMSPTPQLSTKRLLHLSSLSVLILADAEPMHNSNTLH